MDESSARYPLIELNPEQTFTLLANFGFPDERGYWASRGYTPLTGELLSFVTNEGDLTLSYYFRRDMPSIVVKRFLHHLQTDFRDKGVPIALCERLNPTTTATSTKADTPIVKKRKGDNHHHHVNNEETGVEKKPKSEAVDAVHDDGRISSQGSSKWLVDKLPQSQNEVSIIEILTLLQKRLKVDNKHPQTRISTMQAITSSRCYLHFLRLCQLHPTNETILTLSANIFNTWLPNVNDEMTVSKLMEVLVGCTSLPTESLPRFRNVPVAIFNLFQKYMKTPSTLLFLKHKENIEKLHDFMNKFSYLVDADLEREAQDLLDELEQSNEDI